MPKAKLVNRNTLEAHGRRMTFTLINTPIGWQYWTDAPIVSCGLSATRAAALTNLRIAAYGDIQTMIERGLLVNEAAS